MLLLAIFLHTLWLQPILAWLILWLEKNGKKLALLLALFTQILWLQPILAWFILWVFLWKFGKKANAAGAKLVPRNIPTAIAPIAIRLICFIILNYLISFYKSSMSSVNSGICDLVYIKPDKTRSQPLRIISTFLSSNRTLRDDSFLFLFHLIFSYGCEHI
jgi:hypothetical protein